MRKCLQDEFTSIYVFNLRGNQRTSGELSRKEGGKIFGSGSRTPITITLLVKNPAKKHEKAKIYYHDIGDYLTREQKLIIIREYRSVNSINWQEIVPNDKNDWLNQRDGVFDVLIPLCDKNSKNSVFNPCNTNGLKTGRDTWAYNFSRKILESNQLRALKYYESQRENIRNGIQSEVVVNLNEISWDEGLINNCIKNVEIRYDRDNITNTIYRPFCKQLLYYDKPLLQRTYQMSKSFPLTDRPNTLICVPGIGNTKDFSPLIAGMIPDLGFNAGSQCFPLYWYEENKNRQKTLFDEETGEDYIRRDGITDWILKEVRSRYGTREITKEMIFYYVYGLLHSEDYRQRFAADLKKSLPRIPIVERVEDFMDFYKYGKKLADLHLNYETVAPYPGVVVKGDRKVTYETKRDPATGGFIEDTTNPDDYDYFHIWDKMRFKSKDDKSTIIYNGNITIENIPEKAYEYIVNGKSAIEWIVERYCVSRDKKSLIMNDANDWGKEHHKPRYILDLLLSVINVSVQTVDIVKALPKLKFD